METGVARRPIADFDAYADQLSRFVFRSGFIMKPLFAKARGGQKRVIYAEGEDERVLRATQVVLEEQLARPDPDRPPGGDRGAHQALRPDDQARRAISRSSIPKTIRAIATMSRPISKSPDARA